MSVDNDTAGWTEFNISGLNSTDGTQPPFRLVVNRMKSSSPDAEAFIHDPLRVFLEARGSVDAFKDINPDWKVTTLVTNHHRTLSFIHLWIVSTVNSSEQTVDSTIVKLPPGQ
jgi:hypothetical protein